MSEQELPKPEAEFRELRNLLPWDAFEHRNSGLDKHILFANVNVLFGTSAYDLGQLRIIRARMSYDDAVSQISSSAAEKEEKVAYYAALIALPSEERKEMTVLLTGPTYVGIKAVETQKKSGSSYFAVSAVKPVRDRYSGSPEAAKAAAIPGLMDLVEERVHGKIVVLGRMATKQ